jgi:hypothetical protein
MSWNPPTGPPNDASVRPVDARTEVEEALADAVARDRALRDALVATVSARSRAALGIRPVAEAIEEARTLAKRALTKAHEAAEAGQAEEAVKLTAAAQVFAVRVRDGRNRSATLERRISAATEHVDRVETELAENVGRLQAVAAARLPAIHGRKAAKLQQAVDETVAAISVPTGDLVARAMEAARAAVDEDDSTDGPAPVTPVSDEDLEREVDTEGADAILDELRGELGLAAGAGAPERTADGPSSPTGDPVRAAPG